MPRVKLQQDCYLQGVLHKRGSIVDWPQGVPFPLMTQQVPAETIDGPAGRMDVPAVKEV